MLVAPDWLALAAMVTLAGLTEAMPLVVLWMCRSMVEIGALSRSPQLHAALMTLMETWLGEVWVVRWVCRPLITKVGSETLACVAAPIHGWGALALMVSG